METRKNSKRLITLTMLAILPAFNAGADTPLRASEMLRVTEVATRANSFILTQQQDEQVAPYPPGLAQVHCDATTRMLMGLSAYGVFISAKCLQAVDSDDGRVNGSFRVLADALVLLEPGYRCAWRGYQLNELLIASKDACEAYERRLKQFKPEEGEPRIRFETRCTHEPDLAAFTLNATLYVDLRDRPGCVPQP
jgi:hypothetical protein